MKTRKINIVVNLEFDRVSWAEAFVNNSRLPFITVSDRFSPAADINIFIGDHIPWEELEGHSSHIVYYLAATSFNQMLRRNKDAEAAEIENMQRADRVVLTSSSELTLLKEANLHIDFEKVIIGGFPIDTRRYLPYEKTEKTTDICFISDLSDVKNPEFHFELMAYLKKKGYSISHFHTAKVLTASEDIFPAETVYRRLPHEEFLKKLARHRFYISVSKYESLSTSGIEAALLGCIPVCPAHSGFLDWCNSENMYAAPDCSAVSTALAAARPVDKERLKQYDPHVFYEKILRSSRIEKNKKWQ